MTFWAICQRRHKNQTAVACASLILFPAGMVPSQSKLSSTPLPQDRNKPDRLSYLLGIGMAQTGPAVLLEKDSEPLLSPNCNQVKPSDEDQERSLTLA